jgi:DNA-binding LacI/PurR family transcriptional regulator
MEGINPDPENLLFLPYNYPDMTQKLSAAMEKKNKPTAILCFSDFYAMQVYESLRELSVKVPDDISVMGYCGYPGGEMMRPGLSTIDFDYADIGKRAIEILDNSKDWFGGNKQAPCIISPHKLLIRESTAKLNK